MYKKYKRSNVQFVFAQLLLPKPNLFSTDLQEKERPIGRVTYPSRYKGLPTILDSEDDVDVSVDDEDQKVDEGPLPRPGLEKTSGNDKERS